MNILDWLDYEFLGSPLRELAISAAILMAAFAVLFIARRLLRVRLQKLADERTLVSLKVASHVVGKSEGWFLLLVSVYVSLRSIDASDAFGRASF